MAVADKIIKRRKIKIKQDELPKVHIGNHELENVYTPSHTWEQKFLVTEIAKLQPNTDAMLQLVSLVNIVQF